MIIGNRNGIDQTVNSQSSPYFRFVHSDSRAAAQRRPIVCFHKCAGWYEPLSFSYTFTVLFAEPCPFSFRLILIQFLFVLLTVEIDYVQQE